MAGITRSMLGNLEPQLFQNITQEIGRPQGLLLVDFHKCTQIILRSVISFPLFLHVLPERRRHHPAHQAHVPET